MRNRKPTLTRTALGTICGLAFILSLAGCGKDVTISEDEVVPALVSTGYELKYRKLPVPAGAKSVVAGTAQRPNGVSVDFAVVVPKGNGRPEVPIVWMADANPQTGLGNVIVATNGFSEIPGQSKKIQSERSKMALNLETALLAKMPDAPRGDG